VNVHGWWGKTSGSCPAKATVTVSLQGYWCQNIPDGPCSWITLTPGSAYVYPGGGSGNWATSSVGCTAEDVPIGFRAWVHVNVNGTTTGTSYAPPGDLDCTPPE
jgi:hypothetical protein